MIIGRKLILLEAQRDLSVRETRKEIGEWLSKHVANEADLSIAFRQGINEYKQTKVGGDAGFKEEMVERIREKVSLGHYMVDESFLPLIIPIIARQIRDELEGIFNDN